MVSPQTLEELVSETKSNLEVMSTDGKPAIYIFDTGALIELYDSEGNSMLNDKPYGDHVVTEEVLKELERQRDTKRLNDDGKRLVPYALTNMLYMKAGMGEIHRTEAAPDDKIEKKIRDAIINSPTNYKNNSRVGKGDLSIVNFAMAFDPDYCVIVSSDSDIPTILSGLGTKHIGYLRPNDYTILKKSA
jgi:hypothetical protein